MFYEVKVLNPKGEVKKVISTKELKDTHWEKFRKAEESMSFQNSDRPRVPQWIKETLDAQFVGYLDYNNSDQL